MEDRHTIADDGWTTNPRRRIAGSEAWPRCAFYGVFDGHGGSRVARVASVDLWQNIQKALVAHFGGGTAALSATSSPAPASGASTQGLVADGADPASQVTPSSDGATPAAPIALLPAPSAEELTRMVADAFDITECDVLSQARKGRWEDGCTAVSCLLIGQHLIIGNLGDSRAVLCSDGKAVRLSHDHKPNAPAELARIQAAGGFVRSVMGIARLQGDLSLSRAFGDQSYKKPKPKARNGSPTLGGYPGSPSVRASSPVKRRAEVGSPGGGDRSTAAPDATGGEQQQPQQQPTPHVRPSPFVADGPLSSIPDVTTRTLVPQDRFLILACDGVWDVFSDEQAVKLVQEGLAMAPGGSPFVAAEHLVNAVLRSARCTDNVTAVVVCLRWGGANA
jgi:serine/threonine protein phosphatase PrpC